jgi:hypothetical protein
MAAALLLGGALIGGTSFAANPNAADQLRNAAEIARQACAPKIHFDTYSFDACIEQLATRYAKDPIQRLGIEYAGFAVALSTTRVGMTGSSESARYFFWRYQPLQKKLGINDQQLCASLPGDCTIRIAQSVEFSRTKPPPKRRNATPANEPHNH